MKKGKVFFQQCRELPLSECLPSIDHHAFLFVSPKQSESQHKERSILTMAYPDLVLPVVTVGGERAHIRHGHRHGELEDVD